MEGAEADEGYIATLGQFVGDGFDGRIQGALRIDLGELRAFSERMLNKLVGLAIFIGLPCLVITKALPDDVLVIAAILLCLTWLIVPHPNGFTLSPFRQRHPRNSRVSQQLNKTTRRLNRMTPSLATFTTLRARTSSTSACVRRATWLRTLQLSS